MKSALGVQQIPEAGTREGLTMHEVPPEPSESDDIEAAIEEFDGDYDEQELRLYRVKFISEVAN